MNTSKTDKIYNDIKRELNPSKRVSLIETLKEELTIMQRLESKKI
tara:strand:+ start:225 stop:359 length:135 start_codon:yes stop_codon:yes gene_type:complete